MKNQRTGRIPAALLEHLPQMIAGGLTAGQIADLCGGISPETVRKFARKRGLTIQKQDMTMENHPCWNGGTARDRSGYLMQRVPKNGEHGYLIRAIQKRGVNGTDPNGYAPVHRVVMHNKLGRKLKPGEVVDHIDGNHQNNDPSNLRVFASNAEHLQETLAGRVPKWTPEGFARITGRPKKTRQKESQP